MQIHRTRCWKQTQTSLLKIQSSSPKTQPPSWTNHNVMIQDTVEQQ